MKVLLIGEFSGFHVNLKQGLQKLGVSCTLAANGDGWKKIDGADLTLYDVDTSSVWKKVKSLLIEPFMRLKRLYGYDVVQFMDPQMYHPFVNRILFRAIKRHNKKVFVSVPGSCFSLYNAYKDGKLGYYIYDGNPELCQRYESKSLNRRMQEKDESYIYANSTGIIPIMYEYAVGVRQHKNCMQTIPLPFDTGAIEYKPNVVQDKIVIYHGLIREKDKGSQYIKDALEIIQNKYPDQVEVIVKDRMPLKEYLSVLERTNILIDQCKEHCWGMNACYAMAMGKIVFGGASENSLKEFGLESSPVIHIEPNVGQIVSQIEKVLQQKQNFEKMGEESRQFVESFHNSERIAKQYLSVWEGQGGISNDSD